MNKNLIIMLILILPLISLANEYIFDSLDYYRVSTNYNGSAYNGRTILSYGEGGVIVRSTDNGNNWSQVNLNDSFNIVSITNIGNDFYGVVNKQYIIKSTDDGNNWKAYDGGFETEFYKIIAYNNNLYCLSKNTIMVFNTNIEKMKEYKLTSDTTYYDFTISANNIVYSAGNGKLGVINLQNDNSDIIDLKNLGICTDCPVIKNLFSDDYNTYFELSNNLYQYDGNNVEFIFSPIKKGIYTSYNNNLYELYNIINASTYLDSLYFIKIDKQNHNYFHIKYPGHDRYISSLNIIEVSFLSQDIIIAVGKDKLIYMSFNGGQIWELKSHFNISNDYGDIIRFESNNANRISKYAKFISTRNGGITWLPQKNYEPKFSSKIFQSNWGENGTYFKDKMNGLFYGFTLYQGDTNFAYTNNGCETVMLKNVNEFSGYFYGESPKFCTLNDKTIFAFQGTLNKLKYSLVYQFDDTLGAERLSYIDSTQILFIDSYNDVLIAFIGNYKYPKDSTFIVYDSLYYSLITSSDAGKNWNKNDFKLFIPGRIPPTFNIIRFNDKLIIGYKYIINKKAYCEIYKLDLITKQIVKLFSILTGDMYITSIRGFDNKVFIGTLIYTDSNRYYEQYQNDDIEKHPTDWINITPKSRYSQFTQFIKNDSLIILSAYDSLMKSNIKWFAKPKRVTNVDEQVEVSNYLYLSKPYPNPTQDYVKTKFYWDMSNNINDAIIEVYDIMGNVVSDRKQILFNQINNYSGEITWLTKNQQSGVYIISVKLGGDTKAVPVVIVR